MGQHAALVCGSQIATNRSLQSSIESFLEMLVTSPFASQYRVFLVGVPELGLPHYQMDQVVVAGMTLRRTLRIMVACRE